ncbi:C-terminal binding protein [Thalassospira xiamenensis]|uniref:D-3-phosphoglycerate dehydrogenase n=1 Tax=Thalassospira xiamenensis TaxID=220697 RepID=A0A285TP58_9PROT|nr:C-terminal binding protein [Thalassospira xiamenensis]SOC24531.1 D-3-phosphoglycerate dehydrogenase [Thalassospira xiamenensis]
MSRFRLLTPDAQYPDDAQIERRTSGDQVDWDIYRERSPENIPADVLGKCDAMVVWHEMPVTRDVIAKLDRCQIIVRAGVGFDHIDLSAAAEAGIPVCNTPDYGTSEVADHAIALMLTMRRGINSYHRNLMDSPRAGFDHARAPLLARLRGKTFGVVGLGRIGIATALRAKAFGMRVLAYDPLVSRGTEIAVGVDRCDRLEDLLSQSDVVSLHCPLTTESHKMINAERLAMMQPHALLINTARGAIIDIDALLDALRNGTIAGAGIDVLPAEPPVPEDAIALAYANGKDPIVGERLFLTPHAAWSSPESVADARRLSVETAMQYLRDGSLRNLVNAPAQKRFSGAA